MGGARPAPFSRRPLAAPSGRRLSGAGGGSPRSGQWDETRLTAGRLPSRRGRETGRCRPAGSLTSGTGFPLGKRRRSAPVTPAVRNHLFFLRKNASSTGPCASSPAGRVMLLIPTVPSLPAKGGVTSWACPAVPTAPHPLAHVTDRQRAEPLTPADELAVPGG